ncbi:MAG: hypothetical protein RLZ98_533 [Pseudomonadota bacterium]|jgi:arsenate reductase
MNARKSAGSATVTIYHNPRCGTSRKVLDAIRAAGIEPEIIEYLKTPPSKAKLKSLLMDMGMKPGDLVRKKQKEYAAAGLHGDTQPAEEILDAMVEHPVLIERPIVVTAKGTKLCRPADLVHDLLP